MRSRPLSTALLLLISLSVPFQALAGTSGCWDVHGRWTESVLRTSEEQVVVVGSNRGLKTLNHDVFGEWTYGSEHLSNTLHFLFQFHLRKQVADMEIQGVSVEVPFTKFVLVGLKGVKAGEALLDARMNAARYLAVRDAADYALSRGAEAEGRVASVTGTDSPLAKLGLYRFPGGKTHLEPMTKEQRERFESAILTHFGSYHRFHEALRKYYGVGIGSIEADAHFAAKLAGGGEYGPVVTFDFAHFAKTVLSTLELRGGVDWALKGKTAEEVTAFFKLLRSNLDRRPDAWDGPYRDLIGTQTEMTSEAGRAKAEALHKQLADYLRQLNLTDYLQTPWLRIDPTARDRFGAFEKPSGLLFLDIRGLGARGLTAIHETMPRLAELTSRVTELVDRDGLGVSLEIGRDLDGVFGELRTVRETILAPANALLEEVRAEAAASLKRAGLEADDYVLWTSGDDMFVIFRLPEDSRLSPRNLAKRLATDDALRGRVRVAVEELRTSDRVTLEAARDGVGVTADALKKIEALGLGYDVIVERLPSGEQRPRISVTRADGTDMPSGDLRLITKALREWTIVPP